MNFELRRQLRRRQHSSGGSRGVCDLGCHGSAGGSCAYSGGSSGRGGGERGFSGGGG